MTDPLLFVAGALGGLAMSLAWLAVLLKRVFCGWLVNFVSALLDGCAIEMR